MLRRERNGARSPERAGEAGEHGRVGVKLDPLDARVRSDAMPYSSLNRPNSRSTAPLPW
jgi:hypothetical protein